MNKHSVEFCSKKQKAIFLLTRQSQILSVSGLLINWMCLWYPHHRGWNNVSVLLTFWDTPSTVSLCVWSLISCCIFLPSRSLERRCPQRHKPSTWWWEQLAISYDRSAVPGRSRWPPEVWLVRCCYPPHRPSRLWCTYWMYSAGPFSERSAAPLPSVEHCGWAETRRLVVKKGK